jgi:hypothetical protein
VWACAKSTQLKHQGENQINASRIIKTMHDFFQRLIKQSQSFEISHATEKPLSMLLKWYQAQHAKA